MKKAIIFGKGGHARVIQSFIQHRYDTIHMMDSEDEKEVWKNPKGFMEFDFYIGIGDNKIRANIFNKAKNEGLSLPVCLGPNAFIADTAKIGQGSFIGAGCVVMTGAVVGENVIVNTFTSVDHDCLVGDHSQLTAGITLGGETVIGKNCFFGVKAATIPGMKIGDNVQVMAGSLITKSFENNVVIGGYPSKIIKNLEQE